jgi:hypothetical protein
MIGIGAKPEELLRTWVRRQLSGEAEEWFDKRVEGMSADGSDRALQIALGLAPHRLGRCDLSLVQSDLAAAAEARPGWDPRDWSVDQAARILFLLVADRGDRAFAARFIDLCRTADPAEAIALYRGLPLYPSQEALEVQAGEGLRTNIPAVFEAIAHRSPFPRERFDDNRWNQMVLKALFIGSALAPIQGLDARASSELATILCDYARERWAAGRAVSPELWRCVGRFAEGRVLDDLERAARDEDAAVRDAAGLALSDSPVARARDLLAEMPEVADRIRSGALTWDTISPGA